MNMPVYRDDTPSQEAVYIVVPSQDPDLPDETLRVPRAVGPTVQVVEIPRAAVRLYSREEHAALPAEDTPVVEECRAYVVDGVTVTVHGGPTLDPVAQQHFAEIVRAGIRRHYRDNPDKTSDETLEETPDA